MVVAIDVTLALDGGQRIAVLVCQNVTRIRALESMIDVTAHLVGVRRSERRV
jgi:adenylate cyclase